MNFGQLTDVSLPLLKEFVYEAKRRSFAATDTKSTLPDQTSVYSYRPFADTRFPGMIYADMYSGNTIEGGQESVTIDLILRWRNHYYGGTKEQFWDTKRGSAIANGNAALISIGPRFPEVVSAFLKQALLLLPPDFPVRGPRQFCADSVVFENRGFEGEWLYTNTWSTAPLFDTNDPFASYEGQESISLNGTQVYWHAYHGGIIRDKFFPPRLQG